MGERLQRELQRKAPGRTIERGDLLLAEGGADTDRTMEKGVQHNSTTQLARIPAASTGDNQAETGRRTNIASGTGIRGRSQAPGLLEGNSLDRRS